MDVIGCGPLRLDISSLSLLSDRSLMIIWGGGVCENKEFMEEYQQKLVWKMRYIMTEECDGDSDYSILSALSIIR